MLGIGKHDLCPMLQFDGDVAACNAPEWIPFGDGCCIKARAYRDGVKYDFASLPKELKILAVRPLKKMKGFN